MRDENSVYIDVLRLHHCNPKLLDIRQGLKELKIVHYYQKHKDNYDHPCSIARGILGPGTRNSFLVHLGHDTAEEEVPVPDWTKKHFMILFATWIT